MFALRSESAVLDRPAWYRADDPLRTPTYASRALGVAPQTIHRWMRKGVLAFVEIGPYRKKRIYESEIRKQRTEVA